MFSKKLMYGIGTIVLTLGFYGCMNSDVENKSTAESLAVITFNSEVGKLVMNTSGGPLTPNPVNGLNEGDCIYTRFTINYDHQPEGAKYFEATEVQYQLLAKSTVTPINEAINEQYNDSVIGVDVFNSQYFKGYVFLQTSQIAPASQGYQNLLVYYPDSIEANGSPTFFLKIKKKNEVAGSTTTVYNLEAFDLNPVLYNPKYGNDTTYVDASGQKVNLRYVKFNLKYQTGTAKGEPVYKQVGTAPIMFGFEK
jgi:hypothetical protein